MNQFLEGIVAGGIISLFLWILTLFAWPDITPYLVYISYGVNMLYWFNSWIDITALYVLGGVVLSIEAILFLLRKFQRIVAFFRGSNIKLHE